MIKKRIIFIWLGIFLLVASGNLYAESIRRTANVAIPSVRISAPQDGKQQAFLYQADYNSTGPINFSAMVCTENGGFDASVHWTFQLEYETDGAKFPSFTTSCDSNPGTTDIQQTFTSMGGKLKIVAQANVSNSTCSEEITNYVTGTAIHDNVITARLVALYNPPLYTSLPGSTPRLLTGIAFTESSYRQFKADAVKYGITGRWPLENDPNQWTRRGAHIGLMQVFTTIDTAWDWLANTQAGLKDFDDKLKRARGKVIEIRKIHQGLRELADYEMENYALSNYCGSSAEYYVPQIGQDGLWEWVVTDNVDLREYVGCVRYYTAILTGN